MSPASGAASSFDFVYRFELERSQSVQLLVVPDRGNPVYLNGTAGESGWWTEVTVVEGGEAQDPILTNGSEPVALGYVRDDEPIELRLRVHAPPEAMARPGTAVATYWLEREQSRWSLFDGNEEGQEIPATITLLQPAEAHNAAGGSEAQVPQQPWNAPQVALVVGSAILALGLIVLFGGGRR